MWQRPIGALASVIRSSEATTMMELEIELKKASDSLKARGIIAFLGQDFIFDGCNLYLIEHPEYMVDGLSMSQFSFQIPRPLQENYVRKRPAAPHLTAATHSGRPLEPTEANPIAWAGPDDRLVTRFSVLGGA